ncbi:MAG: hypothetical protein ACLFRB_06795 [Thiohalorhabdus sp.]|uniref:DUF7210 family protein n=1 Tax=Thiohalorhabdus sp. TaxID=3094134 RepID=UPI003980B009
MSEKSPKKITVTLAKPHKHRGLWHQPGAELALREDQAERLYKQGKLKNKPEGGKTTKADG